MKRLLSLLVLGLLSAAMVGCEAGARVGDPDDDGDSYRRETTVRDNDGEIRRTETRTETEIRRD